MKFKRMSTTRECEVIPLEFYLTRSVYQDQMMFNYEPSWNTGRARTYIKGIPAGNIPKSCSYSLEVPANSEVPKNFLIILHRHSRPIIF